MNEIWKDVTDYEDYYQVSNMGRYRSKDRYVDRKHNPYIKKGMVLNGTKNHAGYIMVQCGKKQERLHRLVAKKFLDDVPDKNCINHKNGIKTDNRVENLEWCTRKENIKHAYENGLINNIGVNQKYAKMNDSSVRIVRMASMYVYQKDLASYYNVSTSTINSIINKKTWQHVK